MREDESAVVELSPETKVLGYERPAKITVLKSAVWHYRICNSSKVWVGAKRTEQGLKEIPSSSTVSEPVQEDKAAGTSQFSYSDTGSGAVICLRGGLTSSSGDNDGGSGSHGWIWRLLLN